MPTKKQAGGGIIALLVIIIVVGLAFEVPAASELAVMSFELAGLPVTPPIGMAPDLGELAARTGIKGTIGQVALSAVAIVAGLKVLE
ncbi:hypothetical protein [Halobellus sp. EA9]|uniref:hypothetical protein n=1 Tax=Halobellus sp. EA9 TaxID=3421647 RepID=UPI003EBB9BE1